MSGEHNVLVIPGWMGSGPHHWQTHWEIKHPMYRRMALNDWRNVHRPDWVMALDRALSEIGNDVVLVAHSLGCLATVWWSQSGSPHRSRVRAAMLVVPPDLSSAPGSLPALSSFHPPPRQPLPFPSLLVGSETDPYATIEAAEAMAHNWGSAFINAGRVGHINIDSGHGNWPEGERYLEDFLCVLHVMGYGPKPNTSSQSNEPLHPALKYVV